MPRRHPHKALGAKHRLDGRVTLGGSLVPDGRVGCHRHPAKHQLPQALWVEGAAAAVDKIFDAETSGGSCCLAFSAVLVIMPMVVVAVLVIMPMVVLAVLVAMAMVVVAVLVAMPMVVVAVLVAMAVLVTMAACLLFQKMHVPPQDHQAWSYQCCRDRPPVHSLGVELGHERVAALPKDVLQGDLPEAAGNHLRQCVVCSVLYVLCVQCVLCFSVCCTTSQPPPTLASELSDAMMASSACCLCAFPSWSTLFSRT